MSFFSQEWISIAQMFSDNNGALLKHLDTETLTKLHASLELELLKRKIVF